MEDDMEIDCIVDVPDTPDRSNTRNNDRKCVGDPEKREWAFPVANEISNCSNYITVSPLDKSYPSQNGGIFRKGQTEKVIGLGTTHSSGVEQVDKGKDISFRFPSKQSHHETHSSGAERMEKGKTISSRFPSKQSNHERFSVLNLTEKNGRFQQPKLASSHHGSRDDAIEWKKEFSKFPSKQSPHGRISFLDLTEENGQFQQPKPTLSHRGSRDNAIEDKKELKASIGNSSLPSITDSSNTSRNAFTGKCTLDSETLPSPNISMDRGKSISMSNDNPPQSTTEKQVSLPPRVSAAPRGRGLRRLVRNGCISPQNIAARAKQSAEQSNLQTNYVEQSHAGHSVSSNTISPINVDDIVAEERDKSRVKGKGILIHPSSNGINVGTTHTHNSPVIDSEEANGSSSATRNLLENFEGQGGWRTTHNEKSADQHSYDVNGHHSRRNYNVERFVNRQNMNRRNRSGTGSSQNSNNVSGSLIADTPQPTSLIIPEVGQSTRPHPTADSLTKRQRKRESSSGNPIGASHNSEIIFLNSSGESSSSSRSRVLDPELVDLLSTPRFTNRLSEDLDNNDNNSSDARARQLEADEMLARELQEQLYRDDIFEGGGIDDHLTWELQHTEDLLHTSTNSHNTSHPTRLPRANRQPRSRPHQNPSNRRRTVPHVPFSNRMTQLRSRMINRSSTPTTSFRGRRRPQFPLDIDLDMRLDILEALEDAVGDFNDMGMGDDIFNAHRDFNEYDYEMLLALDDQNHQHTGASANQINNLPQSTIQTDNFTDACCICLETPSMGEVIRHLPCLHKFHKDCIDPWLQRKSSCPVCKSSIT